MILVVLLKLKNISRYLQLNHQRCLVKHKPLNLGILLIKLLSLSHV